MLEAFVAALAAALGTQAGDAASKAISALVGLLRRRRGPAEAVAAVEREPDDENRQAALVDALKQAMATDPEFAKEFWALWRRVEVEAPRLVPAHVGPFVDRLAQMSELDSGTEARVVAVVGMPGVGKSALVRRWAHETPDRFPGGQLYVDFTASDGVVEALASCVRALGVDERFVPVKLADLVNLYRTRSARQSLLVVADGVTQLAEMKLLLPSAPGSVLVVTTEYRFGELRKEGARVIELEPLAHDDAVALLASIGGADRIAAEREAAAAVARWCGYLPEALCVAGARLADDPTLTVAELADELADEAGRLAALSLPGWAATGVDSTVAAAFAASYARLSVPARGLYRTLGAMPVVDIEHDLVLSVTRDDRSTARRALKDLLGASLLRRTGHGRYRMHQLVRLHAAQEAAGDDVTPRVVDYYLPRLGWADRAIMGERLRVGGFDPRASGVDDPFAAPDGKLMALTWLEARRSDLLRVLRAAVDHGLDEPAYQMAEGLTALYFNHRHHVDWIEATELGVRAARRQGRRDVEARLRSVVSRVYTDLGDLATARTEIEAAVAAAAEAGDTTLLASVWEFYGRYLQHDNRKAEAVEAYERAIEFNTQAGERRGVALVRYFLGDCLYGMGRSADAMALLREARAALRELGDERMAHRCTFSIGQVLSTLGEPDEAGRELRAAAEHFAARQLWHYEVPARMALADLAKRVGDRAAERRDVERALEVEEMAGGLGAARLRARLSTLA